MVTFVPVPTGSIAVAAPEKVPTEATVVIPPVHDMISGEPLTIVSKSFASASSHHGENMNRV